MQSSRGSGLVGVEDQHSPELTLADLSSPGITGLTAMAEPFSLDSGFLFQQGDVADSMYIVETGEVEIIVRTPGDDIVTLNRVPAGGVVGEVALIDRGVRSATGRVARRTTGWRLGHHAFQTLRAARDPASAILLSRIVGTTCQRVRARIADLVGALEGGDPPAFRISPSVQRERWRSPKDSLADSVAALSPLFCSLSNVQRAAIFSAGAEHEVSRGERLAATACPVDSAFVVLRGAVALSVERDGRGERCGIVGPGRIVSVTALMDGGTEALDAGTREPTELLVIPADRLSELRRADDELAYKLEDALVRELVRELRFVSAQLARLAAHGRFVDRP